MLVNPSAGIVIGMLVITGTGLAPAASAAPTVTPGDPCSNNAAAPDDSLWCDMQAGTWLSKGHATVGQPCTSVGDVRLANGESLAHCAPSGGGLVWEPGSRG